MFITCFHNWNFTLFTPVSTATWLPPSPLHRNYYQWGHLTTLKLPNQRQLFSPYLPSPLHCLLLCSCIFYITLLSPSLPSPCFNYTDHSLLLISSFRRTSKLPANLYRKVWDTSNLNVPQTEIISSHLLLLLHRLVSRTIMTCHPGYDNHPLWYLCLSLSFTQQSQLFTSSCSLNLPKNYTCWFCLRKTCAL